jgi:hypothetical protein
MSRVIAFAGWRWLSHHKSAIARAIRIGVRSSGAFSQSAFRRHEPTRRNAVQRDIVGCEFRSSALRPPPAGQLEGRVLARIVQVAGVRVATGDGKDPGTQDVGHCG